MGESPAPAPVCKVGDRVRVADWPAVEGGFTLVQGEVTGLKSRSKGGYRYRLLCDDGETRSTRLEHRVWSVLDQPRNKGNKKRRVDYTKAVPPHQFILAPMVGIL